MTTVKKNNRSVMLWKLKLDGLDKSVVDVNMKDIRTVRTVVQYDTASLIRWSPDSKALLIVRSLGNNIEIYKVSKKPDSDLPAVQVSHDFPKTRETDLMTLDVASTGRFILTCNRKNELDILDLKGNILSAIATNQMETYCAKISPDGRFVACSGFTPDVRVWEVVFTRSGDFDKVNRAFELTGHTSGIYSFDFSPDSHLMATVSKDGSWKVYNTNIEYKQGQLATLIISGKWKNTSQSAKIALAPDGRVVAIACDSSIYFYSTLNGELCGQVDNAHSAPIASVRFDSSSRFLVTTGDKYVRVFHNVPGFRVAVADLESNLKKATSNAMRERCNQQIKDYQSLISLIENRA